MTVQLLPGSWQHVSILLQVCKCRLRQFVDICCTVDCVAAVAEWYRYRTVACFVTGSSPVPLKTRRIGQRCTLNLSRAETSSRWCGVVVRRGGCQLRCRPRHLTMEDDGCIHVRRYAGERCLQECVIERHSGLTPGVMVRGAISYHGRFNLLRIEGNFNSNRYVREVLQPEVVLFLQGVPGAIFQQDNARPHVAKTVRDFCSAQHMQLLPWPVYSPDMSPIEHVWDFVGRRLARDPRPAASKDELLMRIQAIWNSLPHADIQNLFDSMPRRIAALGGYTKY
ncbi:transposable element Tc1 transposase [Trichonephila clavipes]|nr:transposable element Tc1 transposase [Trichonephila clavipes]